MPPRVHRLLLQIFGKLPRRVRRQLVRWGAPSFTAGALCVIRRSDGQVLLVSQSYRSGWGLPGGLMARGEVPEDAAQREVREEVGLELELGPPTVVIDPIPRRVDVVFGAMPVPGQDLSAVSPRSPEIVDVGWFDPADLPRLQPETEAALAALLRAEASSPPSTPLRRPTGPVDEATGETSGEPGARFASAD